jgi:1,4-dihydroxy-2-naphthoate octaprenyltransferase
MKGLGTLISLFVMGLIVLAITSHVHQADQMARMKCPDGYVLLKHKTKIYCAPGVEPTQ